jgi:hypothetical protein
MKTGHGRMMKKVTVKRKKTTNGNGMALIG